MQFVSRSAPFKHAGALKHLSYTLFELVRCLSLTMLEGIFGFSLSRRGPQRH